MTEEGCNTFIVAEGREGEEIHGIDRLIGAGRENEGFDVYENILATQNLNISELEVGNVAIS